LHAEGDTIVQPEAGLHARPAARFVKPAKGLSSEMVAIKGEKQANAKSSLKIMTLGARKGDTIVIRAEGDDAEEAVDALVKLTPADEHP